MRYDRRIDASLRLLVELSSNTTVREWATAVSLSPARFSHLFAIQTGMMPGKFLRMLRGFRTEEAMACEILKSGSSALQLTPRNSRALGSYQAVKNSGQPGVSASHPEGGPT